MFRRAYVHGVNDALIRSGAIKYASEELAAEVANSVADELPVQPTGGMPDTATAEVASTLTGLSQKLEEAADTAQDAAQAAALAEEVKSAAYILRHKIAAIMGAAVDPADPAQDNTLNQSATVTPEGEMEAARRPTNYANAGVGNQIHTGVGAVGEEHLRKNPALGIGEPGTNSAVETTTKPPCIQILSLNIAAGTGAAVNPSNLSQENTLNHASAVTPEGLMEAARRPTNYANAGVGNSALAELERRAAIGSEMPHQGAAQAATPAGGAASNSVIEQIPGKTAEDQRWLSQFKEVGAKYAGAFPFYMNEMEKIAGVQYLMGLAPSDRDTVATYMQKTAELPEGLKEYIEKKKDKSKDEPDDKSDKKDKKDKGESSEEQSTKTASVVNAGSIIDRLRQLQG